MPIQEIASMLIAFDRHHDWMSKEVKIRPKSGSMLLYSRKKVEDCFPPPDWSWPPTNFQVRYRRDGYCWKKRKDGKTTREDHMKLKVQGMEVGDQWPTNQTTSKSTTPPLQAFLVAWPLRGGEARQLFNQPPAPASWHRAPLTRETPQGRKCLKTPRPAPHLLTRPIARGRAHLV